MIFRKKHTNEIGEVKATEYRQISDPNRFLTGLLITSYLTYLSRAHSSILLLPFRPPLCIVQLPNICISLLAIFNFESFVFCAFFLSPTCVYCVAHGLIKLKPVYTKQNSIPNISVNNSNSRCMSSGSSSHRGLPAPLPNSHVVHHHMHHHMHHIHAHHHHLAHHHHHHDTTMRHNNVSASAMQHRAHGAPIPDFLRSTQFPSPPSTPDLVLAKLNKYSKWLDSKSWMLEGPNAYFACTS